MAVQRKALIIGEAVGDFDKAVDVLARFAFKAVDECQTLNEATARLRNDHYDLVIVPIDKLSSVEMALLDREIRRESAMLIGTAPKADPDLILRGMRAGVQEFLVSPPAQTDLAAAVDRLVRRTVSETQRGLVTAVYSSKGGLGTTTVAVNLAYAYARNHPDRRVALADFVIGGGDIRVMLDLKPAYDIGDLVMKVDRVDEELLFAVLTATAGGVWILPASEKEEVGDMLDSTASASILNHLRAHFNVVVDCEHHMSDRTLAAFDAADKIVLVTQLTVPALRAAKRTLELCERLGLPDAKQFIVVNRFHSGDVVTPADAKDVLGREVFWRIPNDYRAFADAVTRGRPITAGESNSPLARSFYQLAAKLGGTSDEGENGAATPPGGNRLGRILRIGRKG